MTSSTTASLADRYPALVGPSGGFTMLAIDQRESLRSMFVEAGDSAVVGDEVLRDFKSTAMRILSPYASAILVDRQYGLGETRPEALAPTCGLIVAADILHQEPGANVTGSSLDPAITADYLRSVGATAIKLLVIWRAGSGKDERAALVGSFLALAAASGTLALVEGIVRPDGDDWSSPAERHSAIIAAAVELSASGADIYKAEVPGYLPGDTSGVKAASEALTAAIDVPWVILSNGVQRDDFADAVRESRRGGASGFLAGRAIWADIVGAPDAEELLAERSAARLTALSDIVRNTVS